MSQSSTKKTRRVMEKAGQDYVFKAKEEARKAHNDSITLYMNEVCKLNWWSRRKVCRQIMRKINPFTGVRV